MTPKIKAFVKSFKITPKKVMTIKDWNKSQNHESWIKCPVCGIWEDLRKNFYCGDCKSQLHPNFK